MCEQRLSKIHFFILLSLFGFVFPLRSQEYKFRTLGVEDGLSQITVSDICQDEKSRIWIATLDGLNCFDGNHIKVFNHFHNDSISYGNLYVTQMVEDGKELVMCDGRPYIKVTFRVSAMNGGMRGEDKLNALLDCSNDRYSVYKMWYYGKYRNTSGSF